MPAIQSLICSLLSLNINMVTRESMSEAPVKINRKKVLPPSPKSLDEAKGLITAEYQNLLEKEWIASLRAKYPVNVHQDVVDSIAKK